MVFEKLRKCTLKTPES